MPNNEMKIEYSEKTQAMQQDALEYILFSLGESRGVKW